MQISQSLETEGQMDILRMLRAAAVGFFLLGPLAHTYYTLQDQFFVYLYHGAPKPAWDVPLHIGLDQTLYATVYNVIFYAAIGLLRGDAPLDVALDFKKSYTRLMVAGWKLWPFVHIITYTVIPSQHKVLWVDAVEILWATILCLMVNEKREQVVDAVKALDGSVVQEGVYESIETFVTGVREMQWEEELLPRAEQQVRQLAQLLCPMSAW